MAYIADLRECKHALLKQATPDVRVESKVSVVFVPYNAMLLPRMKRHAPIIDLETNIMNDFPQH